MGDDDADLLTPAEVAAMFAVTAQTVSRWADAGKLTCLMTGGGHRRFRRADVERVRAMAGRVRP
jgi:excisionase family DNA binding protein